MPAAIDKSFWSRFKIISRQNALKSTDCPRKIPRLIHFWARRSYQSQNSTGYTLKYSNLTHLFRSTKYELMVKRRPFTFYNIIYFKGDISYKCNISTYTYSLEGVYFVTIPRTQLSVYFQWEENSFQIRYKYNTNELQIHYK